MTAGADELQVAELIRKGLLGSPTVFRGSTFISLRVSGCGIAWRPGAAEWTYRPAQTWLSPRMVRRVAGVPVIIKHPPGGVVDGEELRERAVGVCLLGYVRDNELWAVARIIDADAAAALRTGELDTSPSVLFDGPQRHVQVGKKCKLLLEDGVALLDHLAVCARGVWSRDGAAGVDIGEQHGSR